MIPLLIVLSNIGGIGRIVGVRVQRAVLSKRHSILKQHVRVEEAADLGGTAIGGRVCGVVGGLGRAGGGAELGIEGAGVEDAAAEVGAVGVVSMVRRA
jgi:hypothetical protein